MTEISYAEIYPEGTVVHIKYGGKEFDMFIDDFDTMCRDYVKSMGADELKPCPFCGSKRLVICEEKINGKTQEWIECCSTRCGILGPMWRKTRNHQLVIKYWNKRWVEE